MNVVVKVSSVQTSKNEETGEEWISLEGKVCSELDRCKDGTVDFDSLLEGYLAMIPIAGNRWKVKGNGQC